jgi:hypothetical protein
MLRRSRRLLTGSVLLLLLFLVVNAVTSSAATVTPTRRVRGGGLPASPQAASPLVPLRHRWLSLVSGRDRARDDEARGGGATQQEEASGARSSNKVEAVVASPYGAGGRGGATATKVLASEGASMMTDKATAASTEPKSADKPTGSNNATSAAPATDADASDGNAATSNSMRTSKARPSNPLAANSTRDGTDAMDDASGAIDDDDDAAGASSPAHYSQWDVTNATDFDGMLRNQTYRGPGLLPPDDADPPPHWDVAMTSLFSGLAVLLCVGTAVRRYRNQQRQQRANYEPIHSITV